MDYQKGFSFLEVVLSLLFLTTIILSLLHLQVYCAGFFQQIRNSIALSERFDGKDELLLFSKAYASFPIKRQFKAPQ